MTPSWEGGALQVVDLLVDLIGIEPMTSSMPWKRAPSCATGPLVRWGTTFLFSPLGFDSSNRIRRARGSDSAHDHLQAGMESRVVVEEHLCSGSVGQGIQ